MPRVHYVKKARKDNSAVSKGEEYWWAKFRTGRSGFVRKWAKRPRPSQLTQSDKKSRLYSLKEDLEDVEINAERAGEELRSELESMRDDVGSQLEELGSEWTDAAMELPENLQASEQYSHMEELGSNHESAASDVTSVDIPDEPEWEVKDDHDTVADWNTALEQQRQDYADELDGARSEMIDAIDNNDLEYAL